VAKYSFLTRVWVKGTATGVALSDGAFPDEVDIAHIEVYGIVQQFYKTVV
jgi:hypothetical protein